MALSVYPCNECHGKTIQCFVQRGEHDKIVPCSISFGYSRPRLKPCGRNTGIAAISSAKDTSQLGTVVAATPGGRVNTDSVMTLSAASIHTVPDAMLARPQPCSPWMTARRELGCPVAHLASAMTSAARTPVHS